MHVFNFNSITLADKIDFIEKNLFGVVDPPLYKVHFHTDTSDRSTSSSHYAHYTGENECEPLKKEQETGQAIKPARKRGKSE